jgi:hypothetical protein
MASFVSFHIGEKNAVQYTRAVGSIYRMSLLKVYVWTGR